MFDVFFLQQVLNGLSVGLVYALVAIGFTLIFGVLNVVNFAHGEIYMLGAFAGLVALTTAGPPLLAVVLLVLAVGAALGFGLERLAFRPFRRFRDEASLKSKAVREATLLSSLAVSIIVRELTEKFLGADMQVVPVRFRLQEPILLEDLGVSGPLRDLVIIDGQLWILGAAIAMFAGLQLVLHRTRIGLSIRAVAANPLGAQFVGINANRTVIATFAIGSALGAAAGLLIGLYTADIQPHMGFAPGVKAFVAMVMGGLSSIPGAVICAILLGVAESVATEFISQGWAEMIAYAALLIVLLLFPQGLFGGGRERV
jgi:branched-chain amino acid transport system permease protein